jgi:ABC-2 type transport system ATP-binding protein
MQTLLDVRGLCVRFGKRVVLDGLDLTLAAGETVFVLGSNGAGKTTLLRALLGLAPLRADALSVLGLDVRREAHAVRARVGYVPDRADAPPWMNAAQFFAFLAPHHSTWSASTAQSLLTEFDIDATQPIGELSRGQGTLVMLAAALAHAPRLVLLDEPFAHLDPGARVRVQRGLLAHFDAENGALLVATHDLDVVARLAGRALLLADGRLTEPRAPNEPDAPLPARRDHLEALFTAEARR